MYLLLFQGYMRGSSSRTTTTTVTLHHEWTNSIPRSKGFSWSWAMTRNRLVPRHWMKIQILKASPSPTITIMPFLLLAVNMPVVLKHLLQSCRTPLRRPISRTRDGHTTFRIAHRYLQTMVTVSAPFALNGTT